MAKKKSEEESKPAKTKSSKSEYVETLSPQIDAVAIDENAVAPAPTKQTRAEAKSEQKAAKLANPSSSKSGDEGEEAPKLPKEKRLKGPLLNLALITFIFAIIIALVSIVFPISDVISVNSDVTETLSVEVTIAAPQFTTAPAISACEGSGRLAGLPNAYIFLNAKDGSWKVSSELGAGQLNSNGDCVYMPKINTPKSFNGGTVKARVDFSFGSSETYTVDGYAIVLNIKLN